MLGKGEVPLDLPLPPALAAKLRLAVAGPGENSQPAATETERPSEPAEEQPPEPVDAELLAALRKWRNTQAAQAGIPPYRIFSNATLEELARQRPQSRGALLGVPGIGDVKLQRYGDAVLSILNAEAASPPAEPPAAATTADEALAAPLAAPAEPPAADVQRPPFYWTWRLLSAGFTVDQCAAIRRLDRLTILDHLQEAADEGLAIPGQ
jgi:septal ring-binding cell division protein DamX